MKPKRVSRAVYDTKYHLAWAPKYRKLVLRGDVEETVEYTFREVANNHDLQIDTMKIAEDHFQVFLSLPLRYSIAKVVGTLKSINAKEVFKEHPEVEDELWGGQFWEDGYFVKIVGDKVTEKVIRNYLTYHQEKEQSAQQLELF